MKMLIEFDIDADIIDVPESVIENKDRLRTKFLKWLYDKSIKHKYWITVKDRNGGTFTGVRYRSDAFVEWLNIKFLRDSVQKAVIVQEHVAIKDHIGQMPSIFF